MAYSNILRHSRSLQVRLVDVPLDASSLAVFLFNELPRLLLVFCRSRNSFGSFYVNLGVGVLLFLLCLNSLLILVRFNLLDLGNIVQNATGAQVLDRALSIDTTIEHTNEVLSSGEDQLDVVGNKYL